MWVTAACTKAILISTGGGASYDAAGLSRPHRLSGEPLGDQWIDVQDELRRITAQRHQIARDLHDNFAQALAGISLRLEGAEEGPRIQARSCCGPDRPAET
jgi:signal transduction histidine kinase